MTVKYIVEYKCKDMPDNWGFFWEVSDEDEARRQLTEVKKRDITEARIRVELIQSGVLETWKREDSL